MDDLTKDYDQEGNFRFGVYGTEEAYLVVEAMETYGGSFVQCLAAAFHHADIHNWNRLLNAFPDYWEQYSEMAKTKLNSKTSKNV